MINFFYEVEFSLEKESDYASWITTIIESESCEEGELNYIFCNDEYLHKINVEFLNHDTYTDIITFDNCIGSQIHSDIFISIERVKENASIFAVSFLEELRRVMAHGVLHLCGYGDKSEEEAEVMRTKEDEKIKLFHVEQ